MPIFDKDVLLAAHEHRHLRFDGAHNVRDLGGLPTDAGGMTRHGIVFRSDTLAYLSDLDVARLAALELRSVIDLRTPDECAQAPDRLPVDTALTLHNPGFLPQGNLEMIALINTGNCDAETVAITMMAQYRKLALDHLGEFRTLVSALLAPGQRPLLFHCASGKDRTGLAAALVLLAVGVPREWVMQDYAISNFQRRPVDLFVEAARSPAVEQVMAADPRYLDAALDAMTEAFGSIDRYLAEGLGLDAEARRHLREVLVA